MLDTRSAADAPVSRGRSSRAGSLPSGGVRLPRPERLLDVVAPLLLLALALAIYWSYAMKGGWYYDDWSMYSAAQDSPGGYWSDLSSCSNTIAANRQLVCAFHMAEYNLFGSNHSLYHLAAVAILSVNAYLVYAVVRHCRIPALWALLVSALLILFPGSDSTRLWPVGASGQFVTAMALAAILLTLVALSRRSGRGTLCLHAASLLLSLLAIASYEVALPLIAGAGVLYVLAFRNRRALLRWAADITLILVFIVLRLVVFPVPPDSGFVVERTMGQTLERAGTVLGGAWTTWKTVYAPGPWGTLVLAAGALLVGVVALVLPSGRPAMARWLVALLFGIGLSAVSALIFLPANDFYRLSVDSTFNRLNLPGSFGYTVAATAMLALGYEAVRALTRRVAVAALAVLVVMAWPASNQLRISSSHKQAWESSWSLQQHALAGYRAALSGLPSKANIVGFDTPLWEPGFVPVFTANWDLRGALDYETAVDPPMAWPWLPGTTCGSKSVLVGTTPAGDYRRPAPPLYFVSPERRLAVRVRSQRECKRVLADWGPPPFWAPAVPGAA